jgi:hypothetical protein
MSNFICCLIAAATFAFIGLEVGNQPPMTHSGTQAEVRR